MVVLSRRAVLAGVPASAIALGLPLGSAGSAAAAAKVGPDLLARSRWAAVVGATLTARSTTTTTTSTWSARLTAVQDLPGAPSGSDRRYLLRFTSTTAGIEGTVTLSRSGFTATALHLVPGPTGRTWTAVVNRL